MLLADGIGGNISGISLGISGVNWSGVFLDSDAVLGRVASWLAGWLAGTVGTR